MQKSRKRQLAELLCVAKEEVCLIGGKKTGNHNKRKKGRNKANANQTNMIEHRFN